MINDFSAIACSISAINSNEWLPLGGGTAQDNKPVAILEPGTSLGMAALIPIIEKFDVIDGEGRNCHFTPTSSQEINILIELKVSLIWFPLKSYYPVTVSSTLTSLFENSNQQKSFIITPQI